MCTPRPYCVVMTRICLLACFSLNALLVMGQTKDAWVISGKASGNDGLPLISARISAALLGPTGLVGAPPVLTQGAVSRTLTLPDGSFQLTGSGIGEYVICIQSLKDTYLDPCHWSATPKLVSIKAGGTQSAITITADKGTQVTVRVKDPKNQLLAVGGKPNGTVLVGYYTSNNLFYPLPQTSSTGGEFTYQISVPFSIATRFSLSSSDVNLADDKGSALTAAGKHFSITVAKGQPNPEVIFTVQSLAKKL